MDLQEDIVVKKEELIIKKEMENKEILRERKKISSPQDESKLWMAIKVNNELYLNVAGQPDDIKQVDVKERFVYTNSHSSICKHIQAYSSLFESVLANCSICQSIPAYSSLFQHIPAYYCL